MAAQDRADNGGGGDACVSMLVEFTVSRFAGYAYSHESDYQLVCFGSQCCLLYGVSFVPSGEAITSLTGDNPVSLQPPKKLIFFKKNLFFSWHGGFQLEFW